MNPAYSLAVVQKTALILIPELILLATAIVMMTASAFVVRPRRYWCSMSALSIVTALCGALLAGANAH